MNDKVKFTCSKQVLSRDVKHEEREKGDRRWRWNKKRFSPRGAEVVQETMTYQDERPNSRLSWSRGSSPGITFPLQQLMSKKEFPVPALGATDRGGRQGKSYVTS